MQLFSWKDIERKLLLSKEEWENVIADIDVYADEIVIDLYKDGTEDSAKRILKKIFDKNYDSVQNKLFMDFSGPSMSIYFETAENDKKPNTVVPLFKEVLYHKSAYNNDQIDMELPGVPVIAFHSYKGGVGRTLSLLAFVKAWSSLKDLNTSKKLLIIDADMEAPGITWLTSGQEEPSFSFLDLLEVTQERDNSDEIVELIYKKISELTVVIETEKSKVEHIVLPTYRYLEQLLDMYSSPESLALSYSKKYILAEVLSKLGKKLNAEMVLIDLRAGMSEFSAPVLFDPRVKKYLVTSTSYQSVKGTELLLQQLNKGLPLSENTKIPEILLTMCQEGMDNSDIIGQLVSAYEENAVDDDGFLTDNLVTELPFASELVHLGSLPQIMKNLNGRDFYFRILEIVKNNYFLSERFQISTNDNSRDSIINQLNEFSKKQITAEGNGAYKVLMTESLQNLIRAFKNRIPNTVVIGAKGSGKTFLYREILRRKYWENFIDSIENRTSEEDYGSLRGQILTIPFLASGNSAGFQDIINGSVQNFNAYDIPGKIKNSICLDNKDTLTIYMREDHDIVEWKKIWKQVLLDSIDSNNYYQSLDDLDKELQKKNLKTVFLVDGLEEIFQDTITSDNQKKAITALCRELVDEVSIKYNNIGFIVFLRKDMVRDSISTNFEQFYIRYQSVELKWTSTEALRLVVWIVNQVVPGFYQETVPLEMASREVIEQTLYKLWGVKLGKPNSNEAYSSRWVLAALSDFNGQLQARDIIRFLEKATVSAGSAVYPDRYLMPADIKGAVSSCSADKIGEIKDEIKALGSILDLLGNAEERKKILPFSSETFNLSQAQEKIMKQEGYLRIENDKYYLPEIIRHGLGFKYKKGARPKVLSLLLK